MLKFVSVFQNKLNQNYLLGRLSHSEAVKWLYTTEKLNESLKYLLEDIQIMKAIRTKAIVILIKML